MSSRGLYRKMLSIVKLIERIEAFLAGIMLGVIVASMGLQIGSRVIRGRALSWPEELGLILFMYLSFLAAGALYKQNAHLSVDYFVRRFVPVRKQDVIVRAVWFLSLVTFALLLVGAIKGMEYAMKYTSGAAIPIQRGYLRLPLIAMCVTNLFASVVFLLCPPNEKYTEEIQGGPT